jgi:hypothetical protein
VSAFTGLLAPAFDGHEVVAAHTHLGGGHAAVLALPGVGVAVLTVHAQATLFDGRGVDLVVERDGLRIDGLGGHTDRRAPNLTLSLLRREQGVVVDREEPFLLKLDPGLAGDKRRERQRGAGKPQGRRVDEASHPFLRFGVH